MLTQELLGRRVRVVAWCDHPPRAAARRGVPALRGGPAGTVTQVDESTGRVSVRVEGLNRAFMLQWGDVEVLPTG